METLSTLLPVKVHTYYACIYYETLRDHDRYIFLFLLLPFHVHSAYGTLLAFHGLLNQRRADSRPPYVKLDINKDPVRYMYICMYTWLPPLCEYLSICTYLSIHDTNIAPQLYHINMR